VSVRLSYALHLLAVGECAIFLIDCQKLWVVAEIFLLEGVKVFDMGLFLKCTREWSAFVPFWRRRFIRNAAIFFREYNISRAYSYS